MMQHHPSPFPACAPAGKDSKYLHIQVRRLNQDFYSIQFDAASKALNRTTFSFFSPCLFKFFWLVYFFLEHTKSYFKHTENPKGLWVC